MLLRLVRPSKRFDSSIPQFVQRVPADVRQRALGRTISIPFGDGHLAVTIGPNAHSVRFSLGTRDLSEAKRRQGIAAVHLEGVWQALRADKPVSLSHRQATALAGELYAIWADDRRARSIAVEIDMTPGPDGNRAWRTVAETPEDDRSAFAAGAAHLYSLIEKEDPASLERTLGPLVDELLSRKGILAVDQPSRTLLLDAFAKALRDAMETRQRNAEGDYSADPKANRFPAWEPSKAKSEPVQSNGRKVSLKALCEDWWVEAKAAGRKPATYLNYSKSVELLGRFLKHDDAARVTPEDILAFKDFRLSAKHPRTGRAVSARTVKDGDLAAFKTVFGWAVANRRLPSNPAAGLTIKLGKKPRVRSKGLTDGETEALLAAAMRAGEGGRRSFLAAAKRWVPWLMAYTGARVGEMAQLRKKDVRQEGSWWVLRITPEAGTVKTNEARDVPLHPHLVEQGFPAFVAKAPAGHLFLRPDRTGDVHGPRRGLKNHLAAFARKHVQDSNVLPTHGFRHRFKTVGMDAGIAPRILDAIQGHAPRTAGDSYGEVSLKAMAEAIAKLPRYEMEG